MTEIVVLDTAKAHIEDIYVYSFRRWGSKQADDYLDGLYAMFEAIAERSISWRAISARFELDVDGFFASYRSHFVFWREMGQDEIGIFAVLHQSRDIGNRLYETQDN